MHIPSHLTTHLNEFPSKKIIATLMLHLPQISEQNFSSYVIFQVTFSPSPYFKGHLKAKIAHVKEVKKAITKEENLQQQQKNWQLKLI